MSVLNSEETIIEFQNATWNVSIKQITEMASATLHFKESEHEDKLRGQMYYKWHVHKW